MLFVRLTTLLLLLPVLTAAVVDCAGGASELAGRLRPSLCGCEEEEEVEMTEGAGEGGTERVLALLD